jgi:hypothetical protein
MWLVEHRYGPFLLPVVSRVIGTVNCGEQSKGTVTCGEQSTGNVTYGE